MLNSYTKWNFNAYRFDTQSNERSTWNRIPQNQIIACLGYMGDMQWEEPLGKQGGNISLIPYVTGSASQDFESKEPAMADWGIGGDAKIAVTSGLNLDLTVNPDFSQVEVDRQVTNLDRFEIFFPERRQFFLENADLFGTFGSRRINPFFSRRIGVGEDVNTGENIQNPIHYGARLSGKINNNWRLGLLNMQTAKDEGNGLPSFNYSVAAVQRKVFSRSNVGLIFVNKERFGSDSTDLFNAYNRVAELDYNLASADNRWIGKAFLHRSMTPDHGDGQWAHGARIRYQQREFAFGWNHQRVGEFYNAEVGFVPRLDFWRLNPSFQIFFYPSQNSWINRFSIGGEVELFIDPDEGRTDHEYELFADFQLADQSRLQIVAENRYTLLLDEFDPTGTSSLPLAENTDYNYTALSLTYDSDRRKRFFYRLQPSIGQYFNGQRYTMSGNLGYRFQPFGSIRINASYNYIELPEPYATASLLLIGPRIDLTFTKDLFFTTFIQYNEQIDNININARFQWRFKPVSDFFIVYTDNYTTAFDVKSRAVVFKLTYWLNL
ncbi:MAG: DUF5916 domain-containing protein [Bacteroidota bacterium]